MNFEKKALETVNNLTKGDEFDIRNETYVVENTGPDSIDISKVGEFDIETLFYGELVDEVIEQLTSDYIDSEQERGIQRD